MLGPFGALYPIQPRYALYAAGIATGYYYAPRQRTASGAIGVALAAYLYMAWYDQTYCVKNPARRPDPPWPSRRGLMGNGRPVGGCCGG